MDSRAGQMKLAAKVQYNPPIAKINLNPIRTPPLTIPDGSSLIVEAYHYHGGGREVKSTTITIGEMIGKGSFGCVYQVHLDNSDRMVALKQVLLDPEKINREVDIMNYINGHCNIISLIMHSYIHLGPHQQRYMLIAMEYMPMTLFDYLYDLRQHSVSLNNVRIISYQLFRGVAHLHSHGVCHRDIKPDNTLLDPSTMHVKLADFGSAKCLGNNRNSTYVCSRFYRAPELFADCPLYSNAVDIWSVGCVLAELLKGLPIFASIQREQAQLMHMIYLLGTDGLQQTPNIIAATGLSADTVIPRVSWQTLIDAHVPADLEELLNCCFIYDPAARIIPLRACAHASYDELRTMETLKIPMSNGNRLPPLFNFSMSELNMEPDLWLYLLPLCLT